MPTTFVAQLFDRFSRSRARARAQQGAGLGPDITRSLLVANGGDVAYEPILGGGATFSLQLPRAENTADVLAP